MDARQDLTTATYAIKECARKAVCVLRATEEHLDADRLAHALGMNLAAMSATEALLFGLVADAAHDVLTARPMTQYRKPAMSPTARARAAKA